MTVEKYRIAEVCDAIINVIVQPMTWCSLETNELLVDSLDRLINAPETDFGVRKISYEKALDDFIEQLNELKQKNIILKVQQ